MQGVLDIVSFSLPDGQEPASPFHDAKGRHKLAGFHVMFLPCSAREHEANDQDGQ